MIIVIDGHNLLCQMPYGAQATEQDQQQLIAQLRRYARKKRHKVVIIFDGGDMPHAVYHEQRLITVAYAGYCSTADDEIVRYVRQHHADNMLVISTDRQVCEEIHKLSVETIDADDFISILYAEPVAISKATANDNEQACKTATTAGNAQLDELMRQASSQARHVGACKEIVEHEQGSRRSSSKTLSKRERRMRKKVHKL